MVRDGKLLRIFHLTLLAFGRGTEDMIKKGNEEYINECMFTFIISKWNL